MIRSLLLLSGAALCCGMVLMRRSGWLDRVVSYHRVRFQHELQDLAPIQLQVRVERAGAEYRDSGGWDAAAVGRLVGLLRRQRGGEAVVRRALRPLYRRFLTKKQTYKVFPSLGKHHANDIYYELSSSSSSESSNSTEDVQESWLADDAVLVVTNPVEARLPSARISVKLLREIMEARAVAARHMPSTTRSTIAWIPMNKTSTAAKAEEAGDGTTDATEYSGTGGEGEEEGGEGDGEGGEPGTTEPAATGAGESAVTAAEGGSDTTAPEPE